MSFKSLIDNYREHGLKYFTPKRAYVWLRSLVRKITGYRLKEKDAIIFSEIITYKSLTCPECVELGYCKVCKCPVNELFTAMDVECSDGKFPAFQKKRDWEFIWYLLKKKEFKDAWEEFRNKSHWRTEWKKYKDKEGIHLMKMYT